LQFRAGHLPQRHSQLRRGAGGRLRRQQLLLQGQRACRPRVRSCAVPDVRRHKSLVHRHHRARKPRPAASPSPPARLGKCLRAWVAH
jgi:hypothetical protein